MRRIWVAWLLIAGGATLLGVGAASGFRGLHNLDGVACPAIFASDRLVTVLSGKDQQCDPTREAQRAFVQQMVGAGATVLVAGGVLWGTTRTARRRRGPLTVAVPRHADA